MRKIALSLIILMGVTAVSTSQAQTRKKIAVMTLKVDTELPQGMDKTLNEILLTEFDRVGDFEVLGSTDITSMLELEQKKALLGSCSDESCMAEIGGALGVSLIVVSSIGAVGDKYVISVKILNVAKAKVFARISEMVSRDDREIIAAIKRAVAKVIGAMTGKPLVPIEESPPESKTTFLDVAPWVALGLSLAAVGTGGALAGLADKDATSAQGEYEGSSEWQKYKDAAESKALGADVLFGLAGAAAVTCLVLFLLDDEEQPATSVRLVPANSGAMATFSIRFD